MGRGITYGLSTLIADNSIEGVKLANGAVTNAKINASAAIDYSKLNLAGGIQSADFSSGVTMSKILAKAYTDVTVNNSTTETDIVNYSVPANTLGTTKVLKVTVFFTDLGTFNTDTVTLRLKLGATTLLTRTVGGTNTANFQGKAEFYIHNTTGTSAQEAYDVVGLMTGGYIGNGNLSPMYATSIQQATGAENTTGALTLKVTGQNSSSGAQPRFTAAGYIVELIG